MPHLLLDELTFTHLQQLRTEMERKTRRNVPWRDVVNILLRVYNTTAPHTLPTPDELYNTPAYYRAHAQQ